MVSSRDRAGRKRERGLQTGRGRLADPGGDGNGEMKIRDRAARRRAQLLFSQTVFPSACTRSPGRRAIETDEVNAGTRRDAILIRPQGTVLGEKTSLLTRARAPKSVRGDA